MLPKGASRVMRYSANALPFPASDREGRSGLGPENPGNETRNFAALTNDDLGDKRKSACHFSASLRLGHSTAQDQRARRANVDGAQVLERFGQFGRPKASVAPDVNSSQKHNECHSNSALQASAVDPFHLEDLHVDAIHASDVDSRHFCSGLRVGPDCERLH